jgi:pyruvate dehydrogenase E2 component (dihydrolipoyllysine-residue acetyltransferase)
MSESYDVREIGMPRLSDSMEEATVTRWLKRPGDAVAKGEELVEVETDKATVVYEAEVAGILEEILVDEGGTALLGAPIARLRTAGGAAAPAPVAAPAAPVEVAEVAPAVVERPAKENRARATPVARRLANDLGVGLDGISGSGPGGRIVGSDVRTAQGTAESAAPASVAAAAPPDAGGRGAVEELPQTTTQRTIAQRMSESRSEIPEFTLEAEIRMGAAAALRNQLKTSGREPVPSYNDLILRAVGLALRDFPSLNASYTPGKTLRYERINVGVAIDAGDALLVATIADTDKKSIFEIATESRRLAERGRTRSLSADELANGTFTVSNLGMFGVRRFQAVINYPQVAILAVGEVAPHPFADASGAVTARTTVDVSLSVDHRAVYGAEAARFLQRLRQLLENPIELVLE